MAKTYIDTVKYLVYTNLEIDGLVEKPDVVGAIFGQTEGLLGDELDLRDLQKNGRIGRIEINATTDLGKTTGIIKIPSSLDMVETCIIAAALETVDRVGPCEAKFRITKVEDTRSVKRKTLVDRAKSLLKLLLNTEIPESKEISEMVRDEVKTSEVIEYGMDRLSAGPGIDKSEEIVFVEGRADVVNLLKNDITNVIAIGGAKVTKTIIDISKRKEVTVFLDGDRGGDIILNELVQSGVDIDFISRAPAGVEVEELTRKEIIKHIRNKVPFEQTGARKGPGPERRRMEVPKFRQEYPQETVNQPEPQNIRSVVMEAEPKRRMVEDLPMDKIELDIPEADKPNDSHHFNKDELVKELDSLANTLRARFYNGSMQKISEVQVRDVIKSLSETKDVQAIVFDGIITQRLVDLAAKQGVHVLVGIKIGNVNKTPESIEIITKTK